MKNFNWETLSKRDKAIILILAIVCLVASWGLLAFAWIIYFIYFAPTIIAAKKGCQYKNQVFILNTFLGWTLIGWVGALIWATLPAKDEQKDTTQQLNNWLFWLFVLFNIIMLVFVCIPMITGAFR